MTVNTAKTDSIGTSGLSRREREVLQQPETGDRRDGELAVWRCRIRDKIQPTLVDARLLLEHADSLELADDLEKMAGDEIRRICELAVLLGISKN